MYIVNVVVLNEERQRKRQGAKKDLISQTRIRLSQIKKKLKSTTDVKVFVAISRILC